MNERELLEAARRGDEDASAQLVARYRRELHAHCYRMLGSVPDAEDALQEALLGAWRGLARFEGRSSLRSWLYTITTNACLKALERRPKRVLPIDYGPASDPHDRPAEPLVESVWIEPYPNDPEASYEQRESVELAFIAALQHLPAKQRAALILREVLGFSARETAAALDIKPTAVDSLMQRARKTVDARLPAQTQQAALQSLEDGELRAIVDGFVDAWERGDVDAVVAMLTDDAVLAMPPHPTWYAGRDAVRVFLAAIPLARPRAWRLTETRANGQLAFVHEIADVPDAVTVLTLRGDKIAELDIFRTPEVLTRFA